MNIKDIITLVRAGYTKEEINATIAAAEKAEVLDAQSSAPIDMQPAEAEPAPTASAPAAEPAAPESDPRIKELEDQVRALQAKVIQLSAVDTAPKAADPIMDIANTLINGGKIE